MKVKGWKEVFAFTFVQQIKTKSFIIGTAVITIILALIAFLANFLPTLFLADQLDNVIKETKEDGTMDVTVETLYICNETDYKFSFENTVLTMGFELKELTPAEADAKIAELADSSELAMVTIITADNYSINVNSQYAGGSSVIQKSDCETINAYLSQEIGYRYLRQLGVADEEIPRVMSGVRSSLTLAGEEPKSIVQEIVNMVVPMISAIILFIFIFSYSQLVAQAVAIEKSSRIIEYLLTSVKPLAIIIGKVFAMCCVSLMQFIIIGLGSGAGFLISIPFGIVGKVQDMVAMGTASMGDGTTPVDIVSDLGSVFGSVNAWTLVIMFLTFILGFLFFAGLSGLAGASISKMEDLSAAIQPMSIIGVLGFYLAYFPQVGGTDNVMSLIARYLPISSPFILTSDYMLGKIGIAEALISILILVAADVILMLFVAKVYETIILHTGNRLKIGDMLKMSK